ncbi:hypothetical protein HRE53_13200 [Acaryochloris sp. 'Moss Beach']|uniref:hypothetical protein n=1 Tax=Acaryochloris sp. 'Moss Beach' TaxID=2740837 RepID=UPI001F39BD86|nr:hypothetical protein [Acaryochloris sp. 'Moss Beach']UJB67655.1 hypothetical protein HRE53_13200 [Acaryochloris sp. 'Moss Beach']
MTKPNNKRNGTQPVQWMSLILLLSVLITGCGPDFKSQCNTVSETLWETINKRRLMDKNRTEILDEAENSVKLSAKLRTLDIRDSKLKKLVKSTATAFDEVAEANRKLAQYSDEDGTLSYYTERQQKQKQNAIVTQHKQANGKIRESVDQMGNHCDFYISF